MTEEDELRAAGFDRFGNSWCRAASSLTNGFHDTLIVCTEPEALALARKERVVTDDERLKEAGWGKVVLGDRSFGWVHPSHLDADCRGMNIPARTTDDALSFLPKPKTPEERMREALRKLESEYLHGVDSKTRDILFDVIASVKDLL